MCLVKVMGRGTAYTGVKPIVVNPHMDFFSPYTNSPNECVLAHQSLGTPQTAPHTPQADSPPPTAEVHGIPAYPGPWPSPFSVAMPSLS